MASAKLTKFTICFLIILHNSSVNANESAGRKIKFAASIPYEEDAFLLHKQVEKNGEYVSGHKRMRGRKMVQREEVLEKSSEEAKLDGRSHEPNIPGSVGRTKKVVQRISPAAIRESSKSKVEDEDSKKYNDGESEEVSEAADEVVNMMMRKDYKGADRPRHKPPINNHNPTPSP